MNAGQTCAPVSHLLEVGSAVVLSAAGVSSCVHTEKPWVRTLLLKPAGWREATAAVAPFGKVEMVGPFAAVLTERGNCALKKMRRKMRRRTKKKRKWKIMM